MKKKLLLASALGFSSLAFSQVGVNTNVPQSTLDVVAKGGASDKDGLQAPRLTRAQLTSKGNTLYGDSQKGSLIYITDISGGDNAGPRANIDAVGYYYFDGSNWKKMGDNAAGIKAENGLHASGNTVKLGGPLTEPTVISGVTATNKLSVNADGVDAVNLDSGTLSIDAASNSIGIGTATPQRKLHVNGGMQVVKELFVEDNTTSTASAGLAGQVLRSAGPGVAPKWSNELNIDLNLPTNANGTVIVVNGQLQVAQEVDVRLSNDLSVPNGGIQILGKVTDELMDNKNLFIGTLTSHSFSVEATGLYIIQSNFSLQGAVTNPTGGNVRYGLVDISNNYWVSFAIDTVYLPGGNLRNFSNTRVARLEVGKSYAFAMSNEGSNYTMRGVEGSNGPMTVFSVKRLN